MENNKPTTFYYDFQEELEVAPIPGMGRHKKHAENGQCATATAPCLEQLNTMEESEDEQDNPLIYKISDRPPIHLILFFGFQVHVYFFNHCN